MHAQVWLKGFEKKFCPVKQLVVLQLLLQSKFHKVQGMAIICKISITMISMKINLQPPPAYCMLQKHCIVQNNTSFRMGLYVKMIFPISPLPSYRISPLSDKPPCQIQKSTTSPHQFLSTYHCLSFFLRIIVSIISRYRLYESKKCGFLNRF